MSAARWWYAARRAPGTLRPSVWMESDGPNCARVCNHRYMWAARACAFSRNVQRKWAAGGRSG